MMQINSSNFDAFISQDKPVLLDFWAPWCGPCRMLTPVLEELNEDLGDSVAIGKVNVDDAEDLARQFSVMSIPTLIAMKGGQVVDRKVGYQPKAALMGMIEKAK